MYVIIFNPFPGKPWFLCVCRVSLLKTLWEKEIAHNEQFLLFPQCFVTICRVLLSFLAYGPMAHPSPKSGATFLQHGAMTVVRS